jgi:branched-chain amino acid transport system permease protein
MPVRDSAHGPTAGALAAVGVAAAEDGGSGAARESRWPWSRRGVRGRQRPLVVRMIAAALIAQVIPGILTGSNLLTLNLACTYAVAAVGLSILFSLGGLVSVAQGAVMAVGGYSLLLLFGPTVGLPLALVIAAAAGAAASAVIGLVGARVRSHYFILISLALAEAVNLVITNATSLTGGANGLPLKAAPALLGLNLTSAPDFFRAAVVVVFVVVYLADSLRASRAGLALRAQNVDEYLALASGVSIGGYRVLATVVGGACGGLAGGMVGILDGYLGPQNFGLDTGILLLLMVVIAGTGRSGSVVVSALVLTWLTDGLLTLTSTGQLIYGAGLIALIVFVPDGLGGVSHLPTALHARIGARRAGARGGP